MSPRDGLTGLTSAEKSNIVQPNRFYITTFFAFSATSAVKNAV